MTSIWVYYSVGQDDGFTVRLYEVVVCVALNGFSAQGAAPSVVLRDMVRTLDTIHSAWFQGSTEHTLLDNCVGVGVGGGISM